MKILKQLLIITLFTLLGSLLASLIPFKIPGNVLGLILLYITLELKLIDLKDIKETGSYLITNMAFLFVPLTVGLMKDWHLIHSNLLNLTLILIVSTTFTMIVVAKVSEKVGSKNGTL